MLYFIDPFGCVKNQVDAENMMAYLNKAGWENSPCAGSADVIIVNSCGFIESAKQESINAVLEWRKLYPNKKILLAGCLAQRYAKELSESLEEADGFFGVNDISEITKACADVLNLEDDKSETFTGGGENLFGERPLLSLPGSAYVKISEGCNNKCSYCAIPLIRGNLSSRKISDIKKECRALLKRGIKELCIVGQDIGSFGLDTGETLPQLLDAISAIKGHFWVRLLYIHPDHFPLQILNIMERDSRFLPYFDIPFQHASSKILAAMNRRGNAQKYLELINTIRSRLHGAVIRSTFLLGFPGETEDDFSALLEFQQKAALDWLGCFSYSKEDGTSAFTMKKQVSKKTAAARKRQIEERQIPITEKNIERLIERFKDKTIEVLTEEKIEPLADGNTIWLGRLYCHAPEVDGSALITSCTAENLQAGMFAACNIVSRRGFDIELSICH